MTKKYANQTNLDAGRDFEIEDRKMRYYSLEEFDAVTGISFTNLPFSIRILLENVLRNISKKTASVQSLDAFVEWCNSGGKATKQEIPYMPSRVLLQDFTGVPCMVDLALMRDEAEERARKADLVNPLVRSDLVVDHSVQVDYFGSEEALSKNIEFEYKRNSERYKFLKWAQGAFKGLRIVPPGSGIIHQINLEYLSEVVSSRKMRDETELFLDTCIGADSHTTMSNGLGVLSWGVGGIEAEAVMLGQPYFMTLPEVIGVRLHGSLSEYASATDLVITITNRLRKLGVVGKIVEFVGESLSSLQVTDRATISNMSPEYGATCGFFPIDEQVIDYLKLTGRKEKHIELVREYARINHVWHNTNDEPQYTDVIDFDLASVEPSLAGPRRPQDMVSLGEVKYNFQSNFPAPKNSQNGATSTPPHGGVAIAAITSCTNTSNPFVMIGAGLLARNASGKKLKRSDWVKSSLAPGSRIVTTYLENTGLDKYLEEFGFYTVGYGCTTCIGNSGPLTPDATKAIEKEGKVMVAVLSGNRNYEGRIHPLVKGSYIASPILVVAYAIAGRIDIDLDKEPIGENEDGEKVFLKDIWPSKKEIESTVKKNIKPELFSDYYSTVYDGTDEWLELEAAGNNLYNWASDSTYIKKPTYFDDVKDDPDTIGDILGARVLVKLGDTVTTDHISPAGSISPSSPAGHYLRELDVKLSGFNSYGSRRGNHEVMVRGTFGNIRLQNQIVPEQEGDWTIFWPDNEKMRIFEAATKYRASGTPTVVLAGKEYGSGSSRDWAAKGPKLLGVSAVIAESYERIHRSNLIGMGILPLQYQEGDNAQKLGLDGSEKYHIRGLSNDLSPGDKVRVEVFNGSKKCEFKVLVRLDNNAEVDYYRHGGILPYVLRSIVNGS